MAIGTSAAILGSAAITAGAGLAGAAMNKGQDPNMPQFAQAPQFAESEGARKKWWDYLQSVEDDPNYGAVTPDWTDIWQQAEQKINQYYGGTAVSPGALDSVKASAARRGVSESPAMENALMRMKVMQGEQLEDQATKQGIERARLAEQGRQTWLSGLQGLTSQRPNVQSYTPTNYGGPGDLVAGAGKAIGGAIGDYAQRKWYEDQFNPYSFAKQLSPAGASPSLATQSQAWGSPIPMA